MNNETQYKTHPATEMFPPVEANDLKELADDIRQNGLREPITLCDGMIIDGRSRLLACMKAGVEPVFKELAAGESPARYAWSKNYTRRHLTTGQRLAAAGKFNELVAKEAKRRMSRGGTLAVRQGMEIIPPHEKGPTRDKLAAMVGTNPHYISDFSMIKREAPDLANEILADKLTIPAAKRKIKDSKKANKFETDGGETPIMAECPVVYQAILTVADVVIGANDLARRDEIVRGIHEAIKAKQTPAHPWLTIVRERYAQGILQSHSFAGLDTLPPNWESLEPATRMVSCVVTPTRVEPIAMPGFQVKHDAWQTDIRRAIEGVVDTSGKHRVA